MNQDTLSETQQKMVFLARALRRHTGRYAASQKLSTPALTILSLLKSNPASLPTLARAMATSRQNVRGIAQKLTGRGLAGFEPNPAHKLSSLLKLTESGERFLERIAAISIQNDQADPALIESAQALMIAADRLLDRIGHNSKAGIAWTRGRPGTREHSESKRGIQKKTRKREKKISFPPLTPPLPSTSHWQEEELSVNLL
jgi:DNA-binding MarR family transcriptional regulator